MTVEWVDWTRLFRDTLIAVIYPGFKQASPRVFWDEQIDTGAAWPPHLADALARSKIVLPILSLNYFSSQWCKLELQLAIERKNGLKSVPPYPGFVFPVSIEDESAYPPEVRELQCRSFRQFSCPILVRNSPDHSELGKELAKLKAEIIHRIESAPIFNPVFAQACTSAFKSKYQLTTEPVSPLRKVPSHKGPRS